MIEGVIAQRTLPDGRILAVAPLTYGRANLTIGYDEQTFEHGY